ncbi:MAG: Crp/Fnr family transcriptional regulator [Angelakisella sp.]
MKEIFDIIKGNMLFENIGYTDFSSLYSCLSCRVQKFEKKEAIVLAGDAIDFVGIVLEGSVQIIKETMDGDTMMIAEILAGEMFGETFACASISHSPVTVVASEKSSILFFDFRKIISVCKSSCVFHNRLIENMLKIVARKNLFLNQKIEILSKKNIREKLLCFFEYERKGSPKFTVAYNREELAAYIAADRSAMCAELSRMQRDGLIKYHKNFFELL